MVIKKFIICYQFKKIGYIKVIQRLYFIFFMHIFYFTDIKVRDKIQRYASHKSILA